MVKLLRLFVSILRLAFSVRLFVESQELLDTNANTHTLKVTTASDKRIRVSSFSPLNNHQAGMFELAFNNYDVDKGRSVTITVEDLAGSKGATNGTAPKCRHYIDVGMNLAMAAGETSQQVTEAAVDHNEVVGNLTVY